MAILRKKRDAEKRIDQLDHEGRQATTAVNAFELFYGAHKSKREESNVTEVHRLLSRLLVFPLGKGSAESAGRLFALLEKKGLSVEFRDALIAGVALENKLTLLTKNKAHFARMPGLSMEEW